MAPEYIDGLGRFYSSVFPSFEPRAELRPFGSVSGDDRGVRIRWLGTAGHVIETATTTVMIDPYLTRAPMGRLATLPLVPDESAVRARLPARVDAVLCGHSHFDHLLDAPLIASISGARLIGSPTTCAFGRAHGLQASQLVEVGAHGLDVSVGDIQVCFVPSLHGRILFGRVPFPGVVSAPPRLPARVWHYRMGGAFGLLVRAGDTTVYHNGSADLVDAELEGRHADVLLVGIAGRRSTRDYLERLCGRLQPSVVVPTHHDAFFGPLDDGVRLLPGIDLDEFAAEIASVAPRSKVVTPAYDETLWFDSRARRAFLTTDDRAAAPS